MISNATRNKLGQTEHVLERWQGKGSEHAAWELCTATAAVLKAAKLVDRYGVKVSKYWYRSGTYRAWEYRTVLVDRHPDQPRPAEIDVVGLRTAGDTA